MIRILTALLILLTLPAWAGNLRGVNPEELLELQGKGALIVDIRTAEEWKSTGIIADSAKLTYFDKNGAYDKNAWLKQLAGLRKSPDQPIVLVCRSGNRSGIVGKELAQEPGMDTVYHLEKGLRQWTAENKGLVSQ
jgi:rhodanese-related sulfurtransferase